mgnify:CR=1 FL=1
MALTLNKQTVNLVIDQGCTFEKTITAKNTAGGNVLLELVQVNSDHLITLPIM